MFFDQHRRGGRCVKPASLGLEERERLWATPESHHKWAVGAARLRDLRLAGTVPDSSEV